MTLVEHLSELRRRLIAVVVVMVGASAGAYLFVDHLVALLKSPAGGLEFVYLTPPELFLAYVRLSLFAGITVTVPFTLSEIWLFVQPGLTPPERTVMRFAFLGGTLFFAAGALFAYLVVLPITLRFFLQFSSPAITPMLSFGSYLGFVTTVLIAFGVAFELPVVIILMARLGIVTVAMLNAARPYLIVAFLVLSAAITPPDIVSQLLLAGPMMMLFEVSVVFARIVRKRETDQ